MPRELSSAAARAGYDVHQHRTHVGIQWAWSSPVDRGSHIRERDQAVAEAEAAFEREVKRARDVLAIVEG